MNLGLILPIVFLAVWVAMYVCRTEARSQAIVHYGGSERLWVLLTPVVISVHFALASITLASATNLRLPRVALGVVVFGAGIGLWFWGRTAIGPLRVRRSPDQPPLRFRCDGPFGIVRNPLYLGLLVAAASQLVIAATVPLIVTFALCVVCLAVRGVQEERRLQALLGARYARYCREVKRLVPFIW